MKHHHNSEEPKFRLKSRALFGKPEVPVSVKFLVTKGYVRTELQAIAAIGLFFLSLFILSLVMLNLNKVPTATLDITLSTTARR